MTPHSLKALASSQSLVVVLLFAALFSTPCPAAETIAPDRNISVVQAEPQTPEWKVLWDKARTLAHREQYPEAAELYEELYQRKPNIEEATWEYCKVLIKLEKFSAVEKIIDGLLEKNPRRSDYLLAGAFVALQKENYRAAIDFFGRVFEKDPVGEHSEAALEGLAKSLRLNGQKQLS
ncbi:MAG: tetratricopeptide repeat protein, partial [Desulforhopalus sp.]